MWLPVGYTMHRNHSIVNITAGKYDKLRVFAADSGNADWTSDTVAGGGWMTAKGATELQPPPKNYNASAPNAKPIEPWLFVVSAACYYFAESLIDLQTAEAAAGGPAVAPIGIVNTAIGGTMICDWTDNVTTATCKDPSLGESPQSLWDSKVLPFVNLTVKGFLWCKFKSARHSQSLSLSELHGHHDD
jgi:hypothetical protein